MRGRAPVESARQGDTTPGGHRGDTTGPCSVGGDRATVDAGRRRNHAHALVRPMDSVLILADDFERWLLVALLKGEGFVVLEANDPGHAIRLLLDNNPPLVILAEETPPIDGIAVLSLVRRLTPAPMVVTGWGGETGFNWALLQGADTYITRPIDPRDLLGRTRALLRRNRPQPPGDGGELQIALEPPNKPTALTPVETRLLQCLLAVKGRVATRTELSVGVWGRPGKESSLRFYIFRLRKKLTDLAAGDIRTVRKRGYQLRLLRPELVQAYNLS